MRTTRIFRNLHYRWTIAGLGMDDLAIIGGPTLIAMMVLPSLGLSQVWTLVFGASLAVVILILKRGKPDGYLEAILTSLIMPRHYSHKERDRFVRPFPIPQDKCSGRPFDDTPLSS